MPAFVTAVGLIFGVLTEKISWSVAFKTAVFMPMAISLFAAGVIWRIMDQKEPERGTVNAMIGVVSDWVNPPGPLPSAFSATPALTGSDSAGLHAPQTCGAGWHRPDAAHRHPARGRPRGRRAGGSAGAAVRAGSRASSGGTSSRAAGRSARSSRRSSACPASRWNSSTAAERRSARRRPTDDGTFAFENLEPGAYRAKIGAQTFQKPFEGIAWLGPSLITPAAMIAYIWVWAGFSMVVIAAGLAAIPRDTLEAARTDGATEWQVFRRVTVPLLAPVLSVVFITMLINVLKVFDIILSVAPGSVQDDANVIALAMWRTSFGGVNDFGLGSAIAVFLFLLVIPILAAQRASLPEGGLGLAVAAEELRGRPESWSRRASRGRSAAPQPGARCTSLLLFIGLLWLLPTFALFMTSLMTPEDYNSFGWWKLLSKPSLATWDNYCEPLARQRHPARALGRRS